MPARTRHFIQSALAVCYPLSCVSLGSFAELPGKPYCFKNFQLGSRHHETGISACCVVAYKTISPNPHTQNFSAPPKHLHTHFSILDELPLHVLPMQILSKITEKQSSTESLTTFKICTSVFSTVDKIFHNHHFISTDCYYTIPS